VDSTFCPEREEDSLRVVRLEVGVERMRQRVLRDVAALADC
jgi:hypothetical protein